MEVVDVEFKDIQERTLPVIASEIKTIEAIVYKTTLEGVIQIGKRLEEAKAQIGHGSFSDWCKRSLGYSQRQAQKYMEISTKYSDENSPFSNANISSHLSISKAYSLLALPEEEVENFVEEHAIEDMTVKKLEEEIRKLQAEKTDQLRATEREIKDLKADLLRIENERANMPSTEEIEAELAAVKESLEKAEAEKEKLEKKVEKFKGKAEKAETEKEQAVKEAIDGQEAAIKEAVDKAIEKTHKEAEEQASETIAELRKQVNNSKPTIVKFKERFDTLQRCIGQLQESIAEAQDEQQREKMKAALKAALMQIQEAI